MKVNILESMLTNVISKYGFENEKTIYFSKLIEEYNQTFKNRLATEIYIIYKELMR